MVCLGNDPAFFHNYDRFEDMLNTARKRKAMKIYANLQVGDDYGMREVLEPLFKCLTLEDQTMKDDDRGSLA